MALLLLGRVFLYVFSLLVVWFFFKRCMGMKDVWSGTDVSGVESMRSALILGVACLGGDCEEHIVLLAF